MDTQATQAEVELRGLAERALELAAADRAEVLIYGGEKALTRFASNAIHQNVAEENRKLYLRLIQDGRVGIAASNRLDGDSLRSVARRAREAAAESPRAERPPQLASPTEGQKVQSFDAAASSFRPEQRAEVVREVCQMAAAHDSLAYGAFELDVRQTSYANTQGAYHYHAGTRVEFQTVVRTNGSSGWARQANWQLERVPVRELGEQALRKAIDGAGAQALEPGELPVVLDPYATADLLAMLNTPGMSAKAVAEGRSWMNERIGELAMSELVSIWDDGCDPAGLPQPFDSEGISKQKVEIVSGGVVRGPVYDQASADLAGRLSTGHALALDLPSIARRYSPLASNLFMASGTQTTEELIASTERGLYITRFWYTRHVHPRDCVVTGMTRDGVFLIESGRLGPAIKDLRFTQSYVEAMRNVEAVGSENRLITEDFLSTAVNAPAVKIGKFRFTGATV